MEVTGIYIGDFADTFILKADNKQIFKADRTSAESSASIPHKLKNIRIWNLGGRLWATDYR